MEELFSKQVSAAVKSSERGERKVDIGVAMLMNVVTSPVHKKELLIRLTDESDPFFLYTLALGEEDFQGLKAQQGLLVDFTAFPQKLIDLLELCLSESIKPSPKFLLEFCLPAAERGIASLSVVETNPFRHLNHLSLKFAPATDSHLKKYLADCLLGLKEDNVRLCENLSATKSDLSSQLAQCEEALSGRSRELERLKSDWSSHTATLLAEHSAALTEERERGVASETERHRRQEEERRTLEEAHAARVQTLECRVQELDSSGKELTDHKYRSEAALRELKARLKTAEEEGTSLRSEIHRLRLDNSSMDASSHERERAHHQLQTRLAVLEQELLDKEQVNGRTSELLETGAEQRRSLELSLQQSQRQISKLETAFKTASQEVLKGNEIIQKLQTELRSVKSKLKLKNMVTTQQEKLLVEREAEVQSGRQEGRSLSDALSKKQEEVRKLEEALEVHRQQLEQCKEQLRTNENVIGWLNRQMNDNMMGGGGGGRPAVMATTSLGSIPRASSVHPSPPIVRRPSAPFGAVMGTIPFQQRPQFSSTPASAGGVAGVGGVAGGGAGAGGMAGGGAGQREALGPLTNQENYKQQVVFRGPAKTSAPSPLSAHSLSAGSLKTASPGCSSGEGPPVHSSSSPPAATMATSAAAPGREPWIDPKYLPPEPTPPAFGRPLQSNHAPFVSSVTPGVLKAPMSLGGGREGVGGAPLLSAYFPKR